MGSAGTTVRSGAHEALHRAGLVRADCDGDILVADIEGAIARCCYSSPYDLVDLGRYVELRDVIYQHDFAREAVAAFVVWYGSWDADAFENAHGPLR